MIWTYLFCLVAGGILIAFSIAGDADSDVSGDGEGVANGGHASLIFSTSFWSFSLAGFGLCGVLLEIINGFQSAVPTAPLALMVGVGLGWLVAFSLRLIARRQANTVVNTNDLIGCEAVVTLPLTSHQRGFIEVSVKGSLIRRVALSASQPFEAGARVVIVRDEGTTLVVEPLDLAA